MTHTIKTPPAAEPITLAEMRLHLGISDAAETSRDAVITSRIVSARTWAEQYSRSVFVTQTLGWYGGDFPGWSRADVGGNTLPNCEFSRPIKLRGPVQSVTYIKYVDASGVQQTLDPSKYQVDLIGRQIVPAYGQNWPAVRYQPNAVEVEYIAGFGVAGGNTSASIAAVPEPIKDALRFIVGQWEMFQSSMEGQVRPFTIPNAAKQLLDNYVDLRELF